MKNPFKGLINTVKNIKVIFKTLDLLQRTLQQVLKLEKRVEELELLLNTENTKIEITGDGGLSYCGEPIEIVKDTSLYGYVVTFSVRYLIEFGEYKKGFETNDMTYQFVLKRIPDDIVRDELIKQVQYRLFCNNKVPNNTSYSDGYIDFVYFDMTGTSNPV